MSTCVCARLVTTPGSKLTSMSVTVSFCFSCTPYFDSNFALDSSLHRLHTPQRNAGSYATAEAATTTTTAVTAAAAAAAAAAATTTITTMATTTTTTAAAIVTNSALSMTACRLKNSRNLSVEKGTRLVICSCRKCLVFVCVICLLTLILNHYLQGEDVEESRTPLHHRSREST